MGATTACRARVVAGLIACGAVMILSASSAFAGDAIVPNGDYGPGDSTTTTPEDTTPEDTTATTVDDYAPGDPVTSETTQPVTQVAETVAAAPTTATVATAAELPRTGGSSLPLGMLGVGSVAGGSALLAALRSRRRA